ncbi:MAG: CehA/McbA family metallohydrolase [Candidatus Gastranaerophilales bacterium]|nr:CehA/McbA family metallohydrolase [Candidatus Gastranaerophilales bacterium]
MKYIYPGATHIHTKYSDGTGSIKEIVSAAKKAGLKWIIITDHNNLSGLKNNDEGWHDGVAVIVGEEISPEHSDHYLAFGIKEEISPDIGPENYIKQVNEQGGLGFIAHPDESLTRKNHHPPLRWTDWEMTGFTGIEIWNHLSDLVDNYDPKKALFWYFGRNQMLSGPTSKVLYWWDSLNNETDKIIPAIGGVDVHALDYGHCGINLKIFPYSESLKTVSNVLYHDNELSEDFSEAKLQILNALKYGNNIVVNRILDKSYPRFYIENSQKKAYSGESINLDDSTRAVIEISRKAKIRLVYNGTVIIENDGNKLVFDNLKPGKYRVEVYFKNRPWIFANPICVV